MAKWLIDRNVNESLVVDGDELERLFPNERAEFDSQRAFVEDAFASGAFDDDDGWSADEMVSFTVRVSKDAPVERSRG
jgi:hypothetical protein